MPAKSDPLPVIILAFGGLAASLLVVMVVVIVINQPTPAERAERNARIAERNAQRQAAKVDRPTDQRTNVERVEQFKQSIEQIDPNNALLVDSFTGQGKRLEVTMLPAFALLPRDAKQRNGQAIWSAWAAVASPGDLDAAYITLIDASGNTLGGSSVIAGSIVSVD